MIVLHAWMAGSQAAGPRLFLRASFRHCHYCPYYFFLHQDSHECHHQREECHAWLTLRRISNPTPCTGWQRCFKNNQNSFPQARYFITIWTSSCHVNPIYVSGQFSEGFFGSTTSFLTFYFLHFIC